ncbi:MAG: linear amide C-N hydrolase [Rhizobiales bacterium]|uniref:linear amide C-N hydrolase n=1 Tax=Xanthobacter flavus TaxID=281 RepID=UPI001AD021A8|nr:linear amide C-N hydrolase [Hyphomicrobiales bacterium]
MKLKVMLLGAAAITAGLVACLDTSHVAMACSLILWNTNGQAVVSGRTMDLYIDDKPRLVYLPRGIARRGVPDANAATWTSKYASAVLTGLDTATSDGINEAGLSAHLLYLHGAEHEPADQRPGVSNLLWPQFVLDNFGSVSEALEGLKKVRVVSTVAHGREWPLHLAIEDASGDSAVLEFVGGKLEIHHGKDVTVMTNEPPLDEQLANLKRYKLFGGNLAMPGDIDPMSRFVRASSYLKTLPKPAGTEEALGHLTGVVRTVAVPFGAVDTSGGESADAWPTRWATLSDHTHKVYYVMPVNSPNVFWVDLAKFKPESREILAVDPYAAGLSGDISGSLKSFGSIDKAFPQGY